MSFAKKILTTTTSRIVKPSSSVATIRTLSSMAQAHTSLNEASYSIDKPFAVMDDGYLAGQYGYRVVATSVPISRRSSTMTSQQHFNTRHNDNYVSSYDAEDDDDFMVPATADNNHNHSTRKTSLSATYTPDQDMHDTVRNLDILSSPEVLEILQSHREWDDALQNEKYNNALEEKKVDPYLSDYEEMDDTWSWEEHTTISSSDQDTLEERTM